MPQQTASDGTCSPDRMLAKWGRRTPGLPKAFPKGTQARTLLRESIFRPSSFLRMLLKWIYLKNVLPVTMTSPFLLSFCLYNRKAHILLSGVWLGCTELWNTPEKQEDNLKHCIDVDTTNHFHAWATSRTATLVSNPSLSKQLKEDLRAIWKITENVFGDRSLCGFGL